MSAPIEVRGSPVPASSRIAGSPSGLGWRDGRPSSPIDALRTTPGAWVLGLGGALLVFALFVVALGQNPLAVLWAVLTGAFGNAVGLNRTLARTIPLLLLSAG